MALYWKTAKSKGLSGGWGQGIRRSAKTTTKLLTYTKARKSLANVVNNSKFLVSFSLSKWVVILLFPFCKHAHIYDCLFVFVCDTFFLLLWRCSLVRSTFSKNSLTNHSPNQPLHYFMLRLESSEPRYLYGCAFYVCHRPFTVYSVCNWIYGTLGSFIKQLPTNCQRSASIKCDKIEIKLSNCYKYTI